MKFSRLCLDEESAFRVCRRPEEAMQQNDACLSFNIHNSKTWLVRELEERLIVGMSEQMFLSPPRRRSTKEAKGGFHCTQQQRKPSG